MNYDLKNPCKQCPFRRDISWTLHPERAKEIAHTITEDDQTFQCHKTLGLPRGKHEHCAGAMIMLEHMDRPNQMMRIMERMKFYDRTKLNMQAPVFGNTVQFIEFHARE